MEIKMKTPKLILTAVIILSFVSVSNSDSKGMSPEFKSSLNANLNSDKDPQSKIFKLYDSKQTEFSNVTTIRFELGEDAKVLLTVCDSDGKILETLIDDLMYAGDYNINYKSEQQIISGELTYKLEVKGISGIKNVFAVK
ncbi:MAG TPA: hypothetical protein DCY06_10720 [Bacteroidetes bacterium]|nr:hypothetical protein [Bacteroidota bacterium]